MVYLSIFSCALVREFSEGSGFYLSYSHIPKPRTSQVITAEFNSIQIASSYRLCLVSGNEDPTNGGLNKMWLTGSRPALVQCLLGLIKHLAASLFLLTGPVFCSSFLGERGWSRCPHSQHKGQDVNKAQLLKGRPQRGLLTSCWPEVDHVARPDCNGIWEAEWFNWQHSCSLQ